MAARTSVLYDYQKEYFADESRFKAACFARQTGKTFTTTLEPALDCAEAEALGTVSKWTIFSVSRDRARDAMEQGVKLHLKALGAAFEFLEIPSPTDDVEETIYEVRFPGGSRIRCVAATPNTCRGITGEDIILDEFAHIPNNREIWIAIFPIVSAPGRKLRVISTFNGLGEKFHEIMFSPEMGKVFSRFICDIYRAVKDGLPRNIEELKAGLNDPDGWAQEYECVPVDAATAWLTYELIDGCEDEQAGLPELYTGGYCYLGVDFGRKRDLTTLYLFEDVQNTLWLRERRELERQRWKIQKANIAELFEKYRILRAAMDETGMGSEPVEWAQEQFGDSRVEAVWFTGPRELDMATVLKDRMEDRRIRIPRCRDLRDDLHSVQKTIGATGAPRLKAPRQNGSHADRFWACALAAAAASTDAPPDYSKIQTSGPITSAALNSIEIVTTGWGSVRRTANGY